MHSNQRLNEMQYLIASTNKGKMLLTQQSQSLNSNKGKIHFKIERIANINYGNK